jgi:hypothetical protein
MTRLIAAAMAAALALAPALGAPVSRDKLADFNGTAFGASFETVQTALGAAAIADTDPEHANIKILIAPSLKLWGEEFGVNYTFGDKGTLSQAYALADVPTGNYEVCRAHWANIHSALVSAYGAPDVDASNFTNEVQSANSEFKFKNGAHIKAFMLGCLIQVAYLAPGH